MRQPRAERVQVGFAEVARGGGEAQSAQQVIGAALDEIQLGRVQALLRVQHVEFRARADVAGAYSSKPH